ncbi:MAG TPA: Na+-dependent transporter [Xanthobacteraceae bacterium]
MMHRAGEALAWLGRQGTRAVAASIFVGLALPALAALFKPLVGPTIFCLLTLAFLRVEPGELRNEFVRPKLLVIATLWVMVATPLVLGVVYATFGRGVIWDQLSLALILQAAAPPITSSPAFVALVGLDVALTLALLITTHTITPLTAPFFAALFAPNALPLDATTLAIRLALFLSGSYLLARLIRHVAGAVRINGWREQIDGTSVILLFVFAAALMESASAKLLTDPALLLSLLVLSFAVTFGLMATTTILFWSAGAERALSLGMASGTRNMGLMLAAASGVSDIVWLYIAVAQFPIYFAPQIMSPLVSRILRSRLPPGR